MAATGVSTGVGALFVPGFVVLDAASFHKTPIVIDILKQHNITVLIIPDCYLGLVQILDIDVNCTFKNFLKEAMEDEQFPLVHLCSGV